MENYQEQVELILNEEDQEELEEVYQNEKWKIESMESAIWADSMIFDKKQEIYQIEKTADEGIKKLQAKINKLEEWKETATSNSKNGIEFFKQHLFIFLKKQMEEDKAKDEKKIRKVLKLPYHKVAYKTQKPEGYIEDKKVTDNANHPQFVDFVKKSDSKFILESVQWGEYKKTLTEVTRDGKTSYVDQNGQVVEIITMVDRPDFFELKENKKATTVEKQENEG